MNEDEVEQLLVFLLAHSNVHVHTAAAQAVAAIAANLVSRDVFGKLGTYLCLIAFAFCMPI